MLRGHGGTGTKGLWPTQMQTVRATLSVTLESGHFRRGHVLLFESNIYRTSGKEKETNTKENRTNTNKNRTYTQINRTYSNKNRMYTQINRTYGNKNRTYGNKNRTYA